LLNNDRIIDTLIQNLLQTFLLEDQGTASDYLGIRITKDPHTKTINISQPSLIESVLQDLHLLTSSKAKDTKYITQNTRPDTSFAVHQCARYSSNPSALHELAVKRIGRYLLGSKDKGMVLHPNQNFKLEMFIDADFAGMWLREYSELHECALSRSGYIITYCGCPIHWASKLQSEIALSTTESEYIALSMAGRELLPLRHLVLELHKQGLFTAPLTQPFAITRTSTLEATTIYEDKASCVVLGHSEDTTKCTKHISLKWHRFKDHMVLLKLHQI